MSEGCEVFGEAFRIVEIWKESGLPPLRGFFPKRIDLVVKCWKLEPREEHWKECFEKVLASNFLMSPKKHWKTTFEWVLENHVQILEGKYDNPHDEDKAKEKELLGLMEMQRIQREEKKRKDLEKQEELIRKYNERRRV